jgi:MFS family permease
MAPVAMAFAVLDLTDSPRLVGLVIASQTAAQVTVQLFGGALADRWSRQHLIVAADLLAAASQATMALLLLTGTAQIWQLVALMAANGVGFALHWPASVGLVPQIVERGRLQPANALLSLAMSGAFGLGGACAGVIVAAANAGWAIAVDAATFLVSAWLVAGLVPRPQVRTAGSSFVRDLRDGWREFTSHRWLWAIVAQFSLVVAAWDGAFLVVGPVVADRSLGGAAAWGWIAGAFGGGLLLGGLLGMRLSVHRPMRTATLCMFTFALPPLALTGPSPVAVVAAAAFVAGVGGQLFGVLWNTALHTHVAPEALSRVSAYDILGSIALAPIGVAVAGPLVEAIGSRTTLWIAMAFIVAPTLAVLGVREVRTLSSTPTSNGADDRLRR